MRKLICGLIWLTLITKSVAQEPIIEFIKADFDHSKYAQNEVNKEIPLSIKSQALIALSFYPELKNTKIIFRFKKGNTPLTSRPRVWSTFKKASNRTYIITISRKSNKRLSPILFSNLPYNAQIGVLGHELGHIMDYNTKSTGQILGVLFDRISAKKINRSELNIDRICIDHGLGHQLLAWSTYVRKALNIDEWNGASNYFSNKNDKLNQRYMSPKAIQLAIKEHPFYQ